MGTLPLRDSLVLLHRARVMGQVLSTGAPPPGSVLPSRYRPLVSRLALALCLLAC